MKYLLILLFLFSTHSFSGEADGKGECIIEIGKLVPNFTASEDTYGHETYGVTWEKYSLERWKRKR